jgi:manganese oxidase
MANLTVSFVIMAAAAVVTMVLTTTATTSISYQTVDAQRTLTLDMSPNNNLRPVSDLPSSSTYLESFKYGNVIGVDNTNRTLRSFTLIVEETSKVPITLGPNSTDVVLFPAWTFNGTVPGPTLRMNEGDHVLITVKNSPTSEHTHSMHMHSRHNPLMDGTVGDSASIKPGESFTYDFIAGPAGVYPYHCHVEPIVDHINRGLYGAMIIDPIPPRTPAHEMVMMMNSYDLDLNAALEPTFSVPTAPQAQQILQIANDTATAVTQNTTTTSSSSSDKEDKEDTAEDTEKKLTTLETDREEVELEIERDNEIYTVNGKAFEYMQYPIRLKVDQPVRIYLLNMVEFDPVNNFHLHSDMFKYTPAGTINTPSLVTDVVTLSQGDRGIIEFTPKAPGKMMFHSHINEFSLLGWMGMFEVTS